MSWFKKFFNESPSVPQQSAGVSLSYEEWTAKQQYEQFVASETAGLERCSLPIPTFQPLSYEHLEHKDRWFGIAGSRTDPPKLHEKRILIKPEFTFPPLLIFPIMRSRIPGSFVGHIQTNNVTWCVVTGDLQTIEQALSVMKAGDLYTLINQYQCRWFNRNPYALYLLETVWFVFPQRDSREPYISLNAKGEQPLGEIDEKYRFNPSPLTETAGITPDEIIRVAYHYKCGRLFLPPVKGMRPFTTLADHYKIYSITITTNQTFNHIRIGDTWARLLPIPQSITSALPAPPPVADKNVILTLLITSQDSVGIIEQFIDHLKLCQYPVTFSISAEQPTIRFAITCATVDRASIERQLALHFPHIVIMEASPLQPLPYGVELNLPSLYGDLKPYNGFSIDPYNQLFAVLSELGKVDAARVEIRFSPFPVQAITAVAEGFDSWLYLEQGENENTISNWKRDLQKKQAMYRCIIRLFASADDILNNIISTFFRQYESGEKVWQRAPFQTEQFAGILLSVKELAALVHFPSKEVLDRYADHLETVSMKAKLPPPLYTEDGIEIGPSEARGQIAIVTLPDQIRDRHVYVIGKSGSGKSTLLLNMIVQDVDRGAGVCVIDPHGDLAEAVLDYIPEDRVQDTIYFNPTDPELAIPLDILNAKSSANLGVLADDLVVSFRRLSDSWGEQMDAVLRSTVYTLLRSERPGFFDIQKLLRDDAYRERIVSRIDYEPLKEFWEYDYPKLRNAAAPILHRMAKFAQNETIYRMMSQPSSPLNFDEVMQGRKILLCNLSSGELGEDNSKLLGSLLVSQIQLAAMRRAKLPASERVPFYLYIDEFQNFTTSAFEKILSEARKYALNLTICHQYISQIDEQIRNAILGNVGTIIVLPIDYKDAAHLQHSLGDHYELRDVLNLDAAKHQAICRPATKASDTFSLTTLPPPAIYESYKDEIIKHTIDAYTAIPQHEAAAVHVSAPPTPITGPVRQQPTPQMTVIASKQPAKALPKEFANHRERVLHFLQQAGYLTTEQIRLLCFARLTDGSQKVTASRVLSDLVEAEEITEMYWRTGGKLYASNSRANPTSHNVAVRDLYVKIVLSGYELANVSFFSTDPEYKKLAPDLLIDFLATDGTLIKTLWEYDAGTEGIAELQNKVRKYEPLKDTHHISFVFNDRARLTQARQALQAPFIRYAVLSEFQALQDKAFISGSGTIEGSFFE